MSSHHDWAEEVIADHDAKKPFAPENGQPLRFSVGDRVIYTNDGGAEFRQTITGLYIPVGPSSQYALGKRYLIDSSCPWMPVAESSLRLDDTVSN
jgi:hypothetical protein